MLDTRPEANQPPTQLEPGPEWRPLRNALTRFLPSWLPRLALSALCRILRADAMERLCAQAASEPSFARGLLTLLEVTVEHEAAELARVPRTGPLVVVANHPSGFLDSAAIELLLDLVRPDRKFLANEPVSSYPPIANLTIPVRVLGNHAASFNIPALRASLEWLRGGHALVVFPAGLVAKFEWRKRRVEEGPWSAALGMMTQSCGATVVPVYVDAGNRLRFHIAGLLHPMLRTALLPSEFLHHQGKRVRVRIGTPIPPERLAALPHPKRCASYLRWRTLALAPETANPRPTAPLANAVPPAALAREIAALPPGRLLAQRGTLAVFAARAPEIPAVLAEIARCREEAFRADGEGSGRSADRDRFDDHYWHVFTWDHARQVIPSACRLGFTSEIVPRLGWDGLYTTTLFRLDPRLFAATGPACELGRLFVSPRYQRGQAAFLLLWDGVRRLRAQYPAHLTLFGAASISPRYSRAARELMVDWIDTQFLHHPLRQWVRPRRPWSARSAPAQVAGVDDLSAQVAEMEAGGEEVPTMVRLYLRLGCAFLGFHVDHDFGGCLDGFVLADVSRPEWAIFLDLDRPPQELLRPPWITTRTEPAHTRPA